MDREKLITIIIGLAVGILAAGSYFAFTKYLPQLRSIPNKVTFTPTATAPAKNDQTNGQVSLSLDLDKPENFSSTTDSVIEISGKTRPGVKLVLFANSEEKISSASANGTFSSTIKLEEGENQISVTALDNQNNVAVAKRSVTLEISQ